VFREVGYRAAGGLQHNALLTHPFERFHNQFKHATAPGSDRREPRAHDLMAFVAGLATHSLGNSTGMARSRARSVFGSAARIGQPLRDAGRTARGSATGSARAFGATFVRKEDDLFEIRGYACSPPAGIPDHSSL
jgi:hypothetical protein